MLNEMNAIHTMLLHNTEESDNDFRARSDEDLTLACLFGIVHALQSIIEDGGADHDGCWKGFGKRGSRRRFSSRGKCGLEVSVRAEIVSLQ